MHGLATSSGTNPVHGSDPHRDAPAKARAQGRFIAGSLDAVIRTLRSTGESSPAMALRTVELWLETPEVDLFFFPTRLESFGQDGTRGGRKGRTLDPSSFHERIAPGFD